MFLLLVTWFYYGQPPQASQTAFSTAQRCEAAKQQILDDARRLRAEFDEQSARNMGGLVRPPTVSAVCAAR